MKYAQTYEKYIVLMLYAGYKTLHTMCKIHFHLIVMRPSDNQVHIV